MGRFASNRRRARFAGSQHRLREEERRAVRESMIRPDRPVADDGTGPICPQDAAHGHLRSWTSGSRFDLFCAADSHQGMPFYRLEAVAR